MIEDDEQVDIDHASCSALRDDNVQRVTRSMCRTDGVLEQVSTIEEVLEFDYRRCELILEIQVYIAANDNRDRLDCQTM